MLALGALVVAGLDLEFHLLQGHADLPAGGLAVVQGAQIEVARLVVGLGGGLALVVGLEQEELRLRAHVEPVKAHVVGLLDHPFQHIPGVAHKGRAVGVVHVADEPGHLAVVGPPGEDTEALEIRIEILVGLVDAHKALDGGTVEHALVVDGLLDLGGGNGHILQHAEDVGKLEPDKLNVLLLDDADDVLFVVDHHGLIPLSLFIKEGAPPPGPERLFPQRLLSVYPVPALSVKDFRPAFATFWHLAGLRRPGVGLLYAVFAGPAEKIPAEALASLAFLPVSR